MRRKNLPPFFVGLPILLLLGVGIFPLAYGIWMSLHWWPFAPYRPIRFIGGENYVDLITNPNFARSITLTLGYVGACIGFQYFIGLGLALLTRSGGKVISFLRLWFTIPILMAPVAAALIWRFLYNPLYGPLTIILDTFGTKINWVDPTAALFSIIIADTWQWTPFMFLVLLSGIYSVPRELYEAANVDGASSWQEIRYIILPFLRKITVVMLLLRGTMVFAEIDKIYIITRGGPGRATETLPFLAYETAFGAHQLGLAAAVCFIVLIIVDVIFMLFVRFSRR